MDKANDEVIIRSVWTLPYLGFTTAVVWFTWYVHEFTHWIVARILGERLFIDMSVNHLVDHTYSQESHELLILSAGPAISFIQSIWIFYVMKIERDTVLYPFLITPVVMRLIACILNLVHPNDEGIISAKLGLGLFTLPIFTCLFLSSLVVNLFVSYKLQGDCMKG